MEEREKDGYKGESIYNGNCLFGRLIKIRIGDMFVFFNIEV